MRLNREKVKQNYKILSKKRSNHLKTNSMDNISTSSRSKNIYLNKILQKNLAEHKISIKDNIQNFQTSIKNIFSDEEKRQKAKNYVMNLRNKNATKSQYKIEDDQIMKNKNINFSGSNYGGFYNYDSLRKTYEILDKNSARTNTYYRTSQKEKPISLRKMIDNSPEMNPGFIRVNKINKLNDEIRYFRDSNYYSNNNLVKTNNPGYLNSQNDLNINNINNSGFNGINSDYMNEYYKSPQVDNHDDELYYNGFQYNDIIRSPSYYNNDNSNSIKKDNNKNMNKSKTNNNFYTNTNKILNLKNVNNQKTYSRFNYNSERKEKNKDLDIDIDIDKQYINTKKIFSNLKIEKNRFKLQSQKNKEINKNNKKERETKSSFKKLISVSINKFNIKGNNNKNKYLEILENKNKQNEKLITNLQNTIKNQKKDLDSKTKEISKYRINNNDNKKLTETQKNYENLIKVNKRLNDEKKNYIKEINKLKETINNFKSEEKIEKNIEESFNKLKNDYDIIDDEYKKLKENLDIVINENKEIKENNKKLNEINNQMKKESNNNQKKLKEKEKLIETMNNDVKKQNEGINSDIQKKIII